MDFVCAFIQLEAPTDSTLSGSDNNIDLARVGCPMSLSAPPGSATSKHLSNPPKPPETSWPWYQVDHRWIGSLCATSILPPISSLRYAQLGPLHQHHIARRSGQVRASVESNNPFACWQGWPPVLLQPCAVVGLSVPRRHDCIRCPLRTESLQDARGIWGPFIP